MHHSVTPRNLLSSETRAQSLLGQGCAQTAVLQFSRSSKMKVTVKTVKGAAQSYEVEPELKVTMLLAICNTISLPRHTSPRHESGSRFVLSSDPRWTCRCWISRSR